MSSSLDAVTIFTDFSFSGAFRVLRVQSLSSGFSFSGLHAVTSFPFAVNSSSKLTIPALNSLFLPSFSRT